MTRLLQALLALALMLPAVPVDATHLVPRDPQVHLPTVPEEPLLAQDIEPLRDLQAEWLHRLNSTGQGADAGIQAARNGAEAEAQREPLPGEVLLFTDGFEGDRVGGYGAWDQAGAEAWGVAVGNDTVLSSGTLVGGRYVANARSLLMTPELDLHTGTLDPTLAAAQDLAGPVLDAQAAQDAYAQAWQQAPNVLPASRPLASIDVSSSSLYRTLFQAADNVVNSPGVACAGGLGTSICVPGPGSFVGGVDTDPRDGTYVLEFERRFNLARDGPGAGRDGVRVLVFTEPPTLDLLERCMEGAELGDRSTTGTVYGSGVAFAGLASQPAHDAHGDETGPGPIDPPCTAPRLLDRDVAPGPKPTAAFQGAPAFTGFDGWRSSAIDLSPWAERSVWVGFLFASGNALGDAYFRNPALFELDAQRHAEFYGYQLDDLRLSAPGQAQSIRVRPLDEPTYVPFGRDVPAIAQGEPLGIVADVVNVGTRGANVSLSARVVERDGGATVWQGDLGAHHLAPREGLHVAESVPGLSTAEARYTVIVESSSASDVAATEADPADDHQAQDVDVHTVRHLVPGTLARTAATYGSGDTVSFLLPLANDGNAPVATTVRAVLVDAVRQEVVADAPFSQATPAVRDVSVDPMGPQPGASTVLRWDLALSEPGQYRLFATVDDAEPFNASRDLVPRSLQPRGVPALDGPTPTLDGQLSPGEWPAWTWQPIELRDLYQNRAVVPDGRLALATTADGLAVAVDIAHDAGDWRPDDRVRLLLDTGQDVATEVGAGPLFVQGNVENGTNDRRVAEALIPFGSGIAPGGALRLLVSFSAPAHAAEFRFPAAPVQDGEGFRTPDQSLRDEMASWLPLRLAASSGSTGHRLLSLGIGVDRAPPPVLELDASDCTGLAGWTQSLVRNPGGIRGYDPDGVKWNCAPYGVDGRPRLYDGRTPLAVCGGTACPQWDLVDMPRQTSMPGPGAEGTPFTDPASEYFGYRPDVLVSPPIDLPAIADPYLILRHQYSTEAFINDEATAPYAEGFHPPRVLAGHAVDAVQRARVYVQARDDATGTWREPVLLRPEAGAYTTLASVGLSDPGAPRTVMPDPINSENPIVDGWWWPAGPQPFFQPAGQPLATGGDFSGSPWRVDRIPLFGIHGADEPPQTPLDLSGRTVRLLFAIPNARGTPDGSQEPARDFGWRIDGIAVAEGPQFTRDLTVTQIDPTGILYDPAVLGLGPGTRLPIEVSLANSGLQAVDGFRLCVRAIDVAHPTGNDDPCAGDHDERDWRQRIAPGAHVLANATVVVPDTPGARLSFLAGVVPVGGDDFPADNVLRDGPVYDVRASPNLAIAIGTDQRVASPGQGRALFVQVENRGNVPVTAFQVERAVTFQDGSPEGTLVLGPDHWTADSSQPHGVLAVGAAKALDAIATTPAVVPSTDLRLPGLTASGAYTFTARVRLPGDVDPSDDDAAMVLRTQSTLRDTAGRDASQAFSDPSAADGLHADGTEHVWSVPLGGSLVAGDAKTSQIPLGTDATIELTRDAVDLRSARHAVLILRHRYDLEATPEGGFDGGRVEVSTDDGATWRTLRPDASPLQGLPEGYPSVPLTGDGAFAAAESGLSAIAFTGRSTEVPGSQDGWIKSQFDLARDPGLSRRAAIESFALGGLAAEPDRRVPAVDGGPDAYLGAGWTLDEPNAEARHRTWWVENLTEAPRPHSGNAMLWSGTAGADDREKGPDGLPRDPIELVHDQLDYAFTAQAAPDTIANGPHQTFLTWWQWRAGEEDGATGARYTASLLAAGTDLGRQPVRLGADASGWTQWAMPIDGLAGQPLTLRLDYDSAVQPAFTDPQTANNRGWFIDDVQQVAYQVDPRHGTRHSPVAITDVDGLGSVDAGALAQGASGPWSTRTVPGTPARAPITWSLAAAGAAGRSGGWHVAAVDIPGEGSAQAFRFADGSRQGYPHGADSRLVTPLMDLGEGGSDLRLRFDHQYWFEARRICPLDQVPDPDPETRRLEQGCFLSAIDGGAVEYQVFDAATQSFGPWHALASGFDDFPATLHFEAQTDDCTAVDKHDHARDPDPPGNQCSSHLRRVDRLAPGADRQLASFGGYPAIEERGQRFEATHDAVGTILSTRGFPIGHGTSFADPHPGLVHAAFEVPRSGTSPTQDIVSPWAPYPVSYVFSGASSAVHPDTDGWARESWDIGPLSGHQVRFAFHAVSNPGLASEDGRPADASRRGWSIANVRVEGDALDGKPVRLRLHVATDSTLAGGEWRIDDAVIAGEGFHVNAAVLADGPADVRGDHGDVVRFDGRFATLGDEPLQGIVATLSAVRESDLEPYTGDVQVQVPSCAPGLPPEGCLATPVADPSAIRPGAVAALRLKPLDLTLQPSIPFNVTVHLPDRDEAVLLRWALWRDDGHGQYTAYPLDVPGNAQAEWVAHAVHVDAIEFLPPRADQARHLVPVPGASGDIAVEARLRNAGSTEPILRAKWTVEKVTHKGGADQPHAGTDKASLLDTATVTLAQGVNVRRGAVVDVVDEAGQPFRFHPEGPGLFRITLSVQTPGGRELAPDEAVEIPIGMSTTYLAADFSAPGGGAGWRDASTDPGPDGGGSDPSIRFRIADGSLLWGITDADFGSGLTYCSAPSTCSYPARRGVNADPPAEPAPVTGLEGLALGPAIHLDRVPQGQAYVTLRHGHNLEADDGARIEFVPLDSDDASASTPAFPAPACPGGAAAYTLQPMDVRAHRGVARSRPSLALRGGPLPMQNPPDYKGETSPALHNPLLNGSFTPQRVIGGPPGDAVARYDLSKPATATCTAPGQPRQLQLVNYTVVPVLHVGTRPGYLMAETQHASDPRLGAQGWSVQSIQVSSVAVDAVPAAPVYPVQVGAPKTFFVTVTNLGQVDDRFILGVDERQSTLRDASWLSLPAAFDLAAGQSRRVPVRVFVPADDGGQPGSYLAPIVVSSVSDPLTSATVLARLEVRRVDLPDLAMTLVADLPEGGPPAFEAGKVYPLHATVFNVGGATSRPTDLVLQARDAGGNITTLATLGVPRLCPPAVASGTDCTASRATFTIEWTAPTTPGDYVVGGRIDPADSLEEGDKGNNAFDLAAHILPLQQPDVAIVDLALQGAPKGLADEGDLLVVTANATNHGSVAAHDVRLRLLFGTSTMREILLPSLEPGQTVTLSAARVLSRGDFVVGASLTHDALDGNLDDDDMRRPLRVRGHELSLAAQPATPSVAPGATVSIQLNATNHANTVERALLRLGPDAVGWSARIVPNPLSIAPGASASATLELTAPAGAHAGPTPVRIVAIQPGRDIQLASLSIPVNVTARAGAPAVALQTLRLDPGNGTLRLRVRSQANAPQDLTVALASPAWAPAAARLALSPGEDRVLDLAVAVPVNATVGPHALRLSVRDSAGALLAEPAVSVNVTAHAAARAAWSGAAQHQGDAVGVRRFTFHLDVRNVGNVPMTPRLALTGLADGVTAAALPEPPVLPPGAAWVAPIGVDLAPAADAYGLLEVRVQADGTNASERSAILALPRLDAAPDLHVEAIHAVPLAPVAGKATTLRIEVANTGDVQAPASQLFVSVDGLLAAVVHVDPVPAGGRQSVNASITFTRSGGFLVTAQADGDGNVTELDDGDNGRSLTLDVEKPGLPDRLAPGSSLLLCLAALALAFGRRRGAA